MLSLLELVARAHLAGRAAGALAVVLDLVGLQEHGLEFIRTGDEAEAAVEAILARPLGRNEAALLVGTGDDDGSGADAVSEGRGRRGVASPRP
jgi:hypothetical protein